MRLFAILKNCGLSIFDTKEVKEQAVERIFWWAHLIENDDKRVTGS